MPIRNPFHSASAASTAATAAPIAKANVRRAALLCLALAGAAAVLAAGGAPCSFARTFHVPCPGCGSTRAVLALLHGDLDGVLHNNPLGPIMALLLLVLGVQAVGSVLVVGSMARVGDGTIGKLTTRGILAITALEVVLWAARFFGAFGGPVSVQ